MILIDPPLWPAHGRLFSHVISDTSLAELHAFARRARLPERAFEGDHYDVPEERYADCLAAGAVPVSGTQLARALRDSGLRFRKRRAERPLARAVDGLEWIGAPHVVEVVGSPHEPPRTAGAAVVLVTAAESILLVRNTSRAGWAAPGGKRDPGESVRSTAVREVREEVGLDLDPVVLVPVGYERITIEAAHVRAPWDEVNHLAVFGAHLAEPAAITPDPSEIAEAEWMSWGEAARRAGDAVFWPLLERWRDRVL